MNGLLSSILFFVLVNIGVVYAQSSAHKQEHTENLLQQVRSISVSVLGGEAGHKNLIRLLQGEKVELVIEGKTDAVYHLHGYDLIAKPLANNRAILLLQADFTGRYPLVQHLHDELMGTHEVTVAYVEVRSP